MKILTSFIHYPVCSGRYVTDALKRLGHDVKHIGDSTGNQIPWGSVGEWGGLDPKYAYASDGDLTTHWPDWTPDLIVILESAWAYHHPHYPNVPHVVYGADNHVRNYTQAGIARYFLMHKAVSIQTYDDNTEYLPCAYDPVHFTPSPIEWSAREYDVALIGVMYPRRVQILDALAKAKLKVLAGVGWVYEQYAAAYHNSRISLCVSAAGDVAQRVYETAAMGCAILTDDCPDLAGIEGFSGVVYEDAKDAVEQARAILEGADEAAEMSPHWAQPHTWDFRAARIIQWHKDTYGNTKTAQTAPEAETAIDDLDAEVHAPVTVEELPEPKRKRKRGQ